MDGDLTGYDAEKRLAELRKLKAEADKAEADARKAEAERQKLGADQRWLNRHLPVVLAFLGTLATVSVGFASWVANVEKQRADASRESLKLLVERAEKLAPGQQKDRIAFAGALAAILPYDQAAPLLDGALAIWGTEAETFGSLRDLRARLEAHRPPGFRARLAQLVGADVAKQAPPGEVAVP